MIPANVAHVIDTTLCTRLGNGRGYTVSTVEHLLAALRGCGVDNILAGLRERGLALGGSLRNAVLADGGAVLNPEGLRAADEFVRHKVLDCIGDLSLLGVPVIGHFEACRPGHALNHALLTALLWEERARVRVCLGGAEAVGY